MASPQTLSFGNSCLSITAIRSPESFKESAQAAPAGPLPKMGRSYFSSNKLPSDLPVKVNHLPVYLLSVFVNSKCGQVITTSHL